jgi:uncharacterized protein YcfJ
MDHRIQTLAIAVGLAAMAAGCHTTPVQDGAVVGGALGAATGAVIGHQQGKQGEGALIGAATGALLGALAGDQVAEPAPRTASGRGAHEPASATGHHETRVYRSPTGERYEKKVWVPAPR